jgi:hypothetical protein
LVDNFLSTWRSIGFVLGGFVAGEGSFFTARRSERFARDGSQRLRFVFQVAVAERDLGMLVALRAFLGCGSIHRQVRGDRPDHLPIVTFTVKSNRAHRARTIPFAREFLLPSAKRDQLERWVERLDAYERDRPTRYGRGPSGCSVAGCERPVRGRGMCRSHYYRATGH